MGTVLSGTLRGTLADLLAGAGRFVLRPHGAAPAEGYRLVRRQRAGYADRDFPRNCLIRLVDFPDLLLRTGVRETVKAGRSALVVRAEIPIGGRMLPVAYKRVRRRTWWKVLTALVQPSRALRVWRMGHELLARGVATPRPLAVIVPRMFARRRESWLVTEWLEGVDNLAGFLEASTMRGAAAHRDRLRAAAVSLGRLVGRMHRAGVAHRDLKSTNLLLGISQEGVAAWVIDLDGASLHADVPRGRRVRNLARLAAGIADRDEIHHGLRLRFLRAYLESAGDEGWGWKDAWRCIAAVSRAVLERKRQRHSSFKARAGGKRR